MNILGKRSDLPFSRKSDSKKEKSTVILRMCRILFAARHNWTPLRMSTPLFVAVICRSRGGLSANEKEETLASNDNLFYFVVVSFLFS